MARENVADVVIKYKQAQDLRRPHDPQFRLNAAYCLPREYAKWQGATTAAESNRTGNDVQARFAFDNTGVRALLKYGAICKRLINPDNVRYHKVEADSDTLMAVPAVRAFYGDLTDLLFRKRHVPSSRFGSCQQELYTSLGVYGTGVKVVLWDKPNRTFRYKSWPLYDIFFLMDDMGNVTDVFRRFYLTKRQFELRFPNMALPKKLSNVLSTDMTTKAECFHYVWKRTSDYDPKALNANRMKWGACYVCADEASYIDEESGYLSCPYNITRNMTVSGDGYGYSPAEQAFPALGGVNAMKKTYMKMGHKALDPPLIAYDDGILSGRIDQRPGRITYGGVNSSGQALIREMQTPANFNVAENMIADERKDINDSFLVTLFEILTETPEMTAAQVYERIAEKAALFAPTMSALQEEDQGPQIDREVDLLVEEGEMPEAPPEVIEAKGKFKVNYVNPMNKALHATEVSGFARWVELLSNAANVTQNPEPMDWVDWDGAAPDIGDKMDVRAKWISTPDKVAAKRDERNKQVQMQQAIAAAPAAASIASTAAKQEVAA
jgi:Bacteriophage head to tail connecting protein